MSLEFFRALTPWVSFLLFLGLGTIGWLIRWLLTENLRRFRDFKDNLVDIENSLRHLEEARRDDQKYQFEKYVDKKAFYVTVGKNEALIGRIFKQLNELAKSVNQIVGALNAGENRNVKTSIDKPGLS